jgi:tRNA (cmo5U34)-methyltransferase
MQNEHYLNYSEVNSEYLKNHITENDVNELTCLVPKDDQSLESTLRENGFRYAGKRLFEGKVMVVFKWFRNLDNGHEDMRSFFNRRVHDYDLHMKDGNDYYETTFISLFKDIPDTNDKLMILDLGCGTGAELEYLFQKVPNAHVVCLDVSDEMLKKLRENYSDHIENVETICSSYLGYDFGENCYEFVVACNTLHHLLAEDKFDLCVNIRKALKNKGLLLISDYVADSLEVEQSLRTNYLEFRSTGVIDKHGIYHIDLMLTLDHEVELLESAGFTIARNERLGDNGVIVSAYS